MPSRPNIWRSAAAEQPSRKEAFHEKGWCYDRSPLHHVLQKPLCGGTKCQTTGRPRRQNPSRRKSRNHSTVVAAVEWRTCRPSGFLSANCRPASAYGKGQSKMATQHTQQLTRVQFEFSKE